MLTRKKNILQKCFAWRKLQLGTINKTFADYRHIFTASSVGYKTSSISYNLQSLLSKVLKPVRIGVILKILSECVVFLGNLLAMRSLSTVKNKVPIQIAILTRHLRLFFS